MNMVSPWFTTAELINGIRKVRSTLHSSEADAQPRDEPASSDSAAPSPGQANEITE